MCVQKNSCRISRDRTFGEEYLHPKLLLLLDMMCVVLLRSVSLSQLSITTGFNLYASFLSGVDVIAKFAQLEFRYGDGEKARTMFDKVLTNYPKRTDLWSVFIDLMVKHGSQKEVR